MKRRSAVARPQARRPPPFFAAVLLAYAVVPSSPFGIHAGQMPPGVQGSSHRGAAPSAGGVGVVSPSVPSARAGASSARSKASVMRMSSKEDVPKQATTVKGVSSFLGRLRPRRNPKKERDWKDGEYNATVASKLTYTYASKILDIAAERQLESTDAFHIPQSKQMASSVPHLERIYDKSRAKGRRRLEEIKAEEEIGETGSVSFWKRKRDRLATSESIILAKALLLSQKKSLAVTGMLRLLNTSVQAFPALLVSRLLRLIESGEAVHPSKPLQAALALVAVLSVKMIIENQYFHNVVKMATQVRGSLAGMIFDKSMRLSNGGSGAQTANDDEKKKKKRKKRKKKTGSSTKRSTATLGAGGVLNLMQSDASIIESLALQLHTLWDGILQISIYTFLLYRYLGPSVLWGMAVLLTTIPINSLTLRVTGRLSKKENEAKDARTKRTAESISNMKLLKLQAWENIFGKDIQYHRKEELQRHVKRGAVRALNQAISNAVPAITLVVTLAAYSKTGRPIVASTIFTSISLFNQLRFPLFFYPMLIDSMANGKNAIRRISSYLSQEEITPYVQHRPRINGQGGSIEMKNGNFLWSPSSDPSNAETDKVGAPALCGANLSVGPGEVVAVVGPVGAGKSALVKGLLGELAPVPRMVVDHSSHESSGFSFVSDVPSVVTHGSMAYCAQEAWLSKGTIRESVVFGREYDEGRYLRAIRDAGLDADIVDEANVSAKVAASRGMLTHDTDVGEGGSSLSGGQRARVALARALYEADAGVYLLDDPLAALDASVGSMVFEHVTSRLRSQNAATIFVTNDPSLPRRCDRVILMGAPEESSGSSQCTKIVDTGTYDELISRGHDLRSISAHQQIEQDDDESEEDMIDLAIVRDEAESVSQIEESISQIEVMTAHNDVDKIRVVGGYDACVNDTIRTCHADPDCRVLLEQDPDFMGEHVVPLSPDITIEYDEVRSKADKSTKDQDEKSAKKPTKEKLPKPPAKKLISADETMTTGAVPRSTYITYLKAVGKPLLVTGMLLAYILANGAQFFQQYIIAKWTELGKGDAMAAALGVKYLQSLVYAAGVVSAFLWLRSYLTMRVGVRASEFLHNKMLSSVFSAPLSFFDATPSGQLLSRFGKELETVDRSLPDGIGSVLFCFLQIAFSSLALAGVVTPAMLAPLGIVGFMYAGTMSRFRPAARDLKRCESKSRSPIYTHFGEALRGVETIRSIPSGRRTWSSQHRHLTDENLSVFYSVKALDRWLSVRLETLGNVIVFAAAVASVFLTRAGRLKSGSAGWGLTQALSITGLLTWAVRVLTDSETHFMSVMRVTELTDLESTETKGALPTESSATKKKPRMPKEYALVGEALEELQANTSLPVAPQSDVLLQQSGWPWQGGIQFKDVSMRYNPVSPLVLKNVTVSVPPGTTLGVVGRTGSGKSSLLLTLFRLVEIEGNGSIELDGVDIRSVSLRTLRQSLSIIPQDPVLFEGTVMYNLDATGKTSTEDAWKALEAASPELARQFRDTGNGLDTAVTEGGKNLSVGQRQLICLSRALLRKSKILVLDEATSSVDSKTDAQVQETIRREFVNKGVTVVTVAHRLDTVLGYDKIAVLGDGELIEYGKPDDLLRIPNGHLRSLADADAKNKQKGAQKQQEAVAVA